MTSSNSTIMDFASLALLDIGDLSELPLFDDIGPESFKDEIAKSSGAGFPALVSTVLESETNFHLPDGERSFDLECLLQDGSGPILAAGVLSLECAADDAVGDSIMQPEDPQFEDPILQYEVQYGSLIANSPLSAADVDSILADPSSSNGMLLEPTLTVLTAQPSSAPSPHDGTTGYVTTLQAPSPDMVWSPQPSSCVDTSRAPSPSEVSPAPSTSTDTSPASSELMGLLLKPEKKLKERPAPYSKQGRRTKAVKEEVVEEEIDLLHLSKKDKKKMQNKNAAIRYRQKKKLESDALKGEEDELQSRHDDLLTRVETLQHEVSYLKEFATSVYEKKGIKFDVDAYVRQKLREQA